MNDCIPKPFTPEDLFRMLFKYSTFVKVNRKQAASDKVVEKITADESAAVTQVLATNTSIHDKGLETIDLSYLKKVSSNNEAFMKDMITTFIDAIPKATEEIRAHLSISDWDSLAKAVHKIKPSLAMMGLNKTRDLSALIENNAKDQVDVNQLPENTDKLIVQLESTLEQLQKL
jgi:HPt (histidine-containing phosphotransfer) domain-containing protein